MGQTEIMDIAYDSTWTLLVVVTPIMMIGLLIGLAVGLFQALTQINEMTLTFVPKILAIFLTLLILLPFMMTQLEEFMLRMVDSITALPPG